MPSKILSVYFSFDLSKKAEVGVSSETHCHFIDFYENNKYLYSESYPGNTLGYVEDIAENYTLGILELENSECQSNQLFCRTYSSTKDTLAK